MHPDLNAMALFVFVIQHKSFTEVTVQTPIAHYAPFAAPRLKRLLLVIHAKNPAKIELD